MLLSILSVARYVILSCTIVSRVNEIVDTATAEDRSGECVDTENGRDGECDNADVDVDGGGGDDDDDDDGEDIKSSINLFNIESGAGINAGNSSSVSRLVINWRNVRCDNRDNMVATTYPGIV